MSNSVELPMLAAKDLQGNMQIHKSLFNHLFNKVKTAKTLNGFMDGLGTFVISEIRGVIKDENKKKEFNKLVTKYNNWKEKKETLFTKEHDKQLQPVVDRFTNYVKTDPILKEFEIMLPELYEDINSNTKPRSSSNSKSRSKRSNSSKRSTRRKSRSSSGGQLFLPGTGHPPGSINKAFITIIVLFLFAGWIFMYSYLDALASNQQPSTGTNMYRELVLNLSNTTVFQSVLRLLNTAGYNVANDVLVRTFRSMTNLFELFRSGSMIPYEVEDHVRNVRNAIYFNAIPILFCDIITLLLALVSILYYSLLLIRHNRNHEQRQIVWRELRSFLTHLYWIRFLIRSSWSILMGYGSFVVNATDLPERMLLDQLMYWSGQGTIPTQTAFDQTNSFSVRELLMNSIMHFTTVIYPPQLTQGEILALESAREEELINEEQNSSARSTRRSRSARASGSARRNRSALDILAELNISLDNYNNQ